ncbi:MAG TPA: PadR family transcriptional regulator [Candidatus Binatia bacterium]|nr:PadR family transcriptional regulator [Candidatus Binatia bacterium]
MSSLLQEEGGATAYKVKRSFVGSRSAVWRGSASAVYPAIRRLVRDGLVQEQTLGDARGGRLCSVTEAGRAALIAWLLDAERMVDPGLDPFRVRIKLFSELPDDDRHKARTRMRALLTEAVQQLEQLITQSDALDARMFGFAIRQNHLRLAWLDDEENGMVPLTPSGKNLFSKRD